MKNQNLIIVVLSFLLIGFNLGCESAGKNTAKGAGIGAAAGALAGAIIGHQSGDRKKGALVGAALGAGIGGSIGLNMDKQAKELEKVAETKRTENGIVTKLKGDLLFQSGKSTLHPDSVKSIKKISSIVKKYPENKILVIGHTDSTGSDATNQRISEARASAVRAKMVRYGVPKGMVTAIGEGESSPVASNDTPNGRAKNRRVELQISVDESKVKKN